MQGEQDTCSKDDCNPCQSGTSKKMSCRRSSLGGMVYNVQCMICKDIIDPDHPDENVKCLYHGRTCRCLYTRQKEHISGAKGRKEDNALYNHMQLFHPNQMSKFVFEAEKFFNDVSSHQIYECVCIPGVTHPQGRLDQCLGSQFQHHCSSSSKPGKEEVPLLKKTSQHESSVRESVWGPIEEVVWPQYGGTWGRWRRRGGQNLEDPEMFLKSSLSLLILKVGSSTPLSLSSFTFTFWWLCHCGWSHSLSVYHLKRRRLPWKLVEINVQNLKFNSMVPKSPKQQKTKPVDE